MANPVVSGSYDLDKRLSDQLHNWLQWDIEDQDDYSELVRAGVEPERIAALIDWGLDKKDVTFIIPPRTLSHRIKNKERLTIDESAKTVRVARICALAETVFGNKEKANRWLSKAKKQLNDRTPTEALHDEFGARRVEEMLYQLDAGYF